MIDSLEANCMAIEQRLLGFTEARKGITLRKLIEDTRLSSQEWEHIKDTCDMDWLPEQDLVRIDQLVKEFGYE